MKDEGPITGRSFKFVKFHIVVQLISVLVCQQISCTIQQQQKSMNLRLLPVTALYGLLPAYSDTGYSDTVRRSPLTVTLF